MHRRPALKYAFLLAVVISAAGFLPARPAEARQAIWTAASGFWDVPSNWLSSMMPQAGDEVYLNRNDAIDRTITYRNTVNPEALLSKMEIDAPGSGSMTLDMSYPYNLKVTTVYVGWWGIGHMNVLSGAQLSCGALNVGYNPGSIGILTVSGAGTTCAASGPLIVNAGSTLDISNGAQVTVGATLYLWDPAAVNLQSGGRLSAASVTGHDSTAFNWTGGTLSITGPNDFLLGSTGPLGTSMTLDSSKTLNVAGATKMYSGCSLTLSGGTFSTDSLTRYGGTFTWTSGTLSFTGTGGYTVGTGGALISPLTLDAGKTLNVTNTLNVLALRTLNLYGGNLTVGALTGTGTFNWTSGTLGISGSSGLTIGSTGPLGSSLTLDAGKTLNVATTTTLAAGSALTLAGGSLTTTTLTDAGSAAVNVSSGGHLSNALAYVGYSSGSTSNVTVSGAGSVWSSGGSLYVGGSSTAAGGTASLTVKNGGSLTVAGTLKLWKADSAVTVSASTLTAGTLAGSTGTIRITNPAAGTALTVGSGASDTFSGAIVDDTGTGSLTKMGGGTQTLGGANTYTGATAINAGILKANHATALGNGGNITFGGGTLQFTAASAGQDWATRIKNSTAAVALDTNTQNVTFAGAIDSSNTGGLTKAGAGTLILSATNTYSGTTKISGGALQATDGASLPSGSFLSLDGGVLQASGTFIRSLGTTGSSKFQWTANGGGFAAYGSKLTVNVGGNATPTELVWGTTVGTNIVGALKFGSPTASAQTEFKNPINLYGATRTIDVAAGAGGDSALLSGVVRTSTGTAGITKTGAGTLVLSAANTYTGSTTVSAGALRATSGAGLPAASNLILTGGGILEGSGTTTFTRNLGASGSNTVQWTDGGGFSANGGKMTVAIGGTSSPTALTWGSGSFVPVGSALVFGSLSADSETEFRNSVNLAGGTRTITVNDNPATTADFATISGVLSNGSLTKNGPGLLVLKGGHTYAGTTTVAEGTLKLASGATMASAAYDVAAGATFDVRDLAGGFTLAAGKTLKGNGSVLGDLVVGGTVTPGASPGILTVEDITFSGTGTLQIELGGTARGTEYDVLAASGAVTLQSGSTLAVTLINSYVPVMDDEFDIMDFAGLSGEFSTRSLPPLGDGLSWDTSGLYTSGTILVAPEPATMALVAMGAAAMLRRSRRK